MEKPTPALVESAITFADAAIDEGISLPLGAMSTLVNPPGHSLALLGSVKGHEPELLKVYYQTALIRARSHGYWGGIAHEPGKHAGDEALIMLTAYGRRRDEADELTPYVDEVMADPRGVWLYSVYWCDQDQSGVWSRIVQILDDHTQAWGGEWMGWGSTSPSPDNWVDMLLRSTIRGDITEFHTEVARQAANLLGFPDVRAWATGGPNG